MKVTLRGASWCPARGKARIMNNSTASGTAPEEDEAENPREHSEIAAEGTDGLNTPEARTHSQAAAEGPDDDLPSPS